MTNDEQQAQATARIQRLGLSVRKEGDEWIVANADDFVLLRTEQLATLVLFSETFGGSQLPSATPSA